jgi:autotransporter-associated beta strand protein
MSGSGSLTQEGGGTLTLANNNTYSGGTAIQGGTLQIGAGSTKGSIGTGPITNNTSLVFALGSPDSLTLANGISGLGAVTLTNTGTLILAGNNSYTGTTFVEGGDFKTGSATALPVGVVELDGQNGPAGLFDLNGFNVTLTGLAGTAGPTNGTVANNSGTATNTLTINTAVGGTYSGQIVDSTNQTGAGKIAVLINGGGSQTFDIEGAAGNTYSGGTIISNATLTLSSVNAGNLGANSVGLGSGTVTLLDGTLNLAGSGTQDNGSTWAPGLANTVIVPTNWSGTVAGAQRGQSFNPLLQGGGVFTYLTEYVRGNIGGNWSAFMGQIYWLGTGSGSGQMGIATTNGFYKVFCTNYIVFYNIVAGTPTISFGELADDGTTTIESTNSGNAGGAAAIFSAGGANTSATFGGSIIDNVGIAKVGTGVWGLTNGPTSVVTGYTYNGPTIVSNGILAFSNVTPTASSPITIAAPGILDVTGAGGLTIGSSTAQTIQGNGELSGGLVVDSLGTVLPGATSIGTLKITGSAELAGAIVMKLNIANGVQTNDVLTSSSLLVDSTATLTVSNTGPTLYTGDTFTLFKAGGISGAGFASVNLPATDSTGTIPYTWNTANLMTTGTITLTQGATPSSINFTPSNLVYSVSSGLVNISWPSDQTGWYLEAQTNPPSVGITTNWLVVPGSSSTNSMTFQISPTNSVFYRLFYTTNTPP